MTGFVLLRQSEYAAWICRKPPDTGDRTEGFLSDVIITLFRMGC